MVRKIQWEIKDNAMNDRENEEEKWKRRKDWLKTYDKERPKMNERVSL